MPTTWKGPPPVTLPPIPPVLQLRGILRVVLFGIMTLGLLPIFALLRATGGRRDRWVALLWSRIALACLGLRWRRTGKPIEQGILVSNHVSWVDPLAVGALALSFFVAKHSVRSWPFIGPLCRFGRVEFVERTKSDTRRQVTVLRDRLERAHLLCFFPEGTSTDGLRLLPFRSTLFETLFTSDNDVLVQPMVLFYQPNATSGLPASFYGWWGDMTFPESLWQIVTRSEKGSVDVSFLSPLNASNYSDRKALATACRVAIGARIKELYKNAAI